MKRIAVIINAIMMALAFGFMLKAEPSFAANNEGQTKYNLSKSETVLTLGGTGFDIVINPKPSRISYIYHKEYLSVDSTNGHITAIRHVDMCQNIKVVTESDTLIFAVKKIDDNAPISKIINIIDQEYKSQINGYKKEIQNLHKQIADLKKNKPQETEGKARGKNTTFFITIIISLAGLLVLSIIVLIYLHNDRKDKDLRIYNLNDTIHRSKEDDDLNGKNLRINNLERENQRLKIRVRELEDSCYKMQQNVKETHENTEVKTEPYTDIVSVVMHDEDKIDTKHTQKQKFSLYSDAIVDGSLNKVKERPNDDTIFELILNEQNSTSAKVVIYSGAKRRIIANASFLEGCEKQIIGSNDVVVEREGIAEKDSTTGVWNLIKRPKVLIK